MAWVHHQWATILMETLHSLAAMWATVFLPGALWQEIEIPWWFAQSTQGQGMFEHHPRVRGTDLDIVDFYIWWRMILSPHVCDTNKIALLKSQTLPVWCHLDSRKYPSLIAGGYPQPWNHHGIWWSWGLTKNPKHRREEITAIPTYHVLPSDLVIYIVCTARNLEFCRRDHGISFLEDLETKGQDWLTVQKRPIFRCKIVSYIYIYIYM